MPLSFWLYGIGGLMFVLGVIGKPKGSFVIITGACIALGVVLQTSSSQ